MRPTFAEINLSNLRYNYLNIKNRVKEAKVMAVVKADAYGHGMLECVAALETISDHSPDYYGVALTEEGEELRKAKLTDKPILTFSPFNKEEVDIYKKRQIIPTVFSIQHLKDLKKLKLKNDFPVHVKVDTGMGRLGVKFSEAFDFILELSKLDKIKIDGVYTHFATSDEKIKSFANLQLSRFKKVLEKLKETKIDYGLAHAANSGAIIDMPNSHLDMVRPGISLYGYYPSMETSEAVRLRPVMSIFSRVDSVKNIEKDESVSYGRRFIAEEDTKIATVPFGYADGFLRSLTNEAEAIIDTEKFPQVGTVTMDRIMFKVNGENVKTGDVVILIGKTKNSEITAWDLAKLVGTIPYEILCGISGRVPRVYKN